MKKLFPLLLCFTLFACSGLSDNIITIDLNTNYERSGRGVLVLYSMSEMEDSLRKQITFPNLSQVSDTVFGTTYFSGNNHSALEKEVLLLVGNLNSESPLIWTDKNNDLDFSGNIPHIFSDEQIDISIPDINQPEIKHTVRFYKPPSEQKDQMQKMVDMFVAKGEPYVDFFLEQRMNIKVGDMIFDGDSIRVGMMDWDVNGVFGDIGSDRIIIGDYQGAIKGTDQASGAVILDSTTYFQGLNHAYKVVNISPSGSFLSLKPTISSNVDDQITAGDPIPDFSFTTLSGQETSIAEFLRENKMLYLNFWATWCGGCHQEIKDLQEIHSKYADRVNLVSLNYNEDIHKITPFIEDYQVNWLNGYSTAEINQSLFVQGLPRNILVDSTGTIVEMDIHPATLVSRLKSATSIN